VELGLKGKVAVVTGGSRGIGRAIAQALAKEGVTLVLAARGADDLEATAQQLRAAGAQVRTVVADAARTDDAERIIATATEGFGALDLLINNAGGSRGSGPLDSATDAQWAEVLDLNLLSAVRCSRPAVEWMKGHGGGAILHMSSIYGREYARSAPYTAAKAGVIALGKEMAVDLAQHRIRVNALAPGSILFPGGSWDRRSQKDPEGVKKLVETELPWKRFGTPEEVAQVAVFLCSAPASWLSGACLPVDGAQGRAF
jgi:3-oxoacyl-[acyl-carrier protein] reductase